MPSAKHFQRYEFQAQEFIDETGIDALAVCIGNVHGKYPASGPKLRLDLLKVDSLLSSLYVLVAKYASDHGFRIEIQVDSLPR